MSLHVGKKTHVGNVRSNNEDAYFIRWPLLAVADGMGGHKAGELASALALETLAASAWDEPSADTEVRLRSAIEAAHRRIVDAVAADEGLRGMGTTLTAVVVGEQRLYVAHVGDSRAYLWRDNALQLLTTDHSVVAELVKAGQLDAHDASRHPQRHVLTRAVSGAAAPEVDMIIKDVLPGDTVLLCTDGLTAHVADEEIAAVLKAASHAQAAADELVRLALEGGGSDNVTVVVARAEQSEVSR